MPEGMGVDVVIPHETASNMGAVETWEDAKLWAAYFLVRTVTASTVS